MKNSGKYQHKKILVMGLAKSGKAAAFMLKKLGALVTVNDRTPLDENPDAREMAAAGFEVMTGGHPLDLLEQGFDYIVKNPGIPYNKVPLLLKARELGIPILTEVQIAYEISEAPMIGITATNGKTTTTMLIYEMLKAGGLSPRIAGNIGEVATLVAEEAAPGDVLVTELSSFQLMGITDFRPKISLILNITEAHLDYHTDLEEYRQAKLGLVKNQEVGDFFVYNADDAIVKRGLQNTRATGIPFSMVEKVNGAYATGGKVWFKDEEIIPVSEILLKGDHNLQDVLGAVAVCRLYGCDIQPIRQVLREFTGVRHRLQFVGEAAGVKYYNNSKATNVIATSMSLRSFESPVILIAGGLDRGHDLSDLAKDFGRVRAIVAYGETKERFYQLAASHGISCQTTETLEEAVPAAAALAHDGDYVLLAPACASWDQFKNFEERGDCFIEAVSRLVP
ncbi:MAG: UDP-N-acetylmuramoyl-L-alanine--D-glutamate ligase [Turicibacter sp.]|nr:UDP-N-acetylmuramoyl-L-alanine--D-glutamate ligase [Turicibacter sp.]